MSSSGGWAPVLLILAVAAPGAGALATALAARRAGERAARASIAGAGLGLAAALLLLVAVGLDGPAWVLVGADAGLNAGRLAALLLVLIALVGLLVPAFASRYLTGDPRHARFFLLTGLTVTATAAMVAAATLAGLVVAWVLAGAGLVALIAHERDLPASRVAARRAAGCFTIGDGALVLALVLVLATAGDLDLRDTTAAARQLGGEEVAGIALGPLVAFLVVIAALVRSAQIPFGGWLPGTVAAPTPVSALLHAGVVNAGGILLVTLAPIVLLAPAAVGLAFAAGAVTALYGTALMLARTDVKGQLAHSTMGQMGFMVLQCSLGALSAAVFHLVGHGLYKATLFLGSGSVVHERKALRRAPGTAGPRGGTRRALADAACAVLLPLAALAAGVALVAPGVVDKPGGPVLLAFAWASGAQAAFWWLRLRRPGDARRIAVALAVLALAMIGYVAALGAVERFLAPDLPAIFAEGWAPSWLVVPVLLLAAAVLALRWSTELAPGAAAAIGARTRRLQLRLYALARRAGEAPTVGSAFPSGHRRPRAVTPIQRIPDPQHAGSI